MSVTTVRLQAEVEQHLEAIAGRLHRSKGWVTNQALPDFPKMGTPVELAPVPDSIRDMVFGKYVVRYSVHVSAIIICRRIIFPPLRGFKIVAKLRVRLQK